jgi:tetratricopeptide (TPR) repeat protein
LADAAPPRFLVILGASGAGKSSFLRAGLLPRLRRDDRAFHVLPIVRPERAAISGETGLVRSLEGALAAAGLRPSRAEVKAAVAGGAATVAPLLARLAEAVRVPELANGADGGDKSPAAEESAGRDGAAPRLVLPLDQGEELFLAEGQQEAQALLVLLRDLLSDASSNLILLATIRSDAYERLQTAPALEGVSQQTLSLPPLPRGAYQTVIEGPADRLKNTERRLTIEPALTAGLLADIETGGGKDALPLLAFTLERLWLEYGGSGRLALQHYRSLGGIAGSIEAAVERALAAADADPRVPRDREARTALLRRALIPWLAGIDPETQAPRRRVARLAEIPEEARPLVEHLVAERLLATDVSPETQERTIEPAHEALLRQWGLLQGWLQEDFAALSALEGVKRAARDWGGNAGDPAWLAHGAGRLEDAERFAARADLAGFLDTGDRAYLAACRTAESERREREEEQRRALDAARLRQAETERDAARRLSRRTRLAAAVLALVAVLAIGAGWQAMQAERRASEQAALALAASAQAEAETARATAEAARANDATARAESEAARAAAEADRAATNYELAKDTLDTVLYDVVNGLAVEGLPIATVQTILSRLPAALDQLAAAAPDDIDLQERRARLAVASGNAYAMAGDLVAASANLEGGLDIFAAIEASTKPGAELLEEVSQAWLSLAQIRTVAGDAAGAAAAFQASLKTSREWAALDPEDLLPQATIAAATIGLGRQTLTTGNVVFALVQLQEGIGVTRRLLASGAIDADQQRASAVLLARGLDGVALIKMTLGDNGGAMEAWQESLAQYRDILTSYPSDLMSRENVSQVLSRMGGLYQEAGNQEAALASYEESLAIARSLAAMDPDSSEIKTVLAEDLGWLASAKKDTAPQEALAAAEEMVALSRALLDMDGSNMPAQAFLAAGLRLLGELKLDAHDNEAALAAYEESLAAARILAALLPENPDLEREVSISLDELAEARYQTGDTDGARASYEESLAIARGLAAANPDDGDLRQDLVISLENVARIDRVIADANRTAGDLAGALAAYQAQAAVHRELAAIEPTSLTYKINLVVDLWNVQSFADELGLRRASVEEALRILGELDEADLLTSEQASWPQQFRDALARTESPTDEAARGERN